MRDIFCEASRCLAMKQNYGDIRLLQQCIHKSRFAADPLNDDVIMSAIKVLASQSKEVRGREGVHAWTHYMEIALLERKGGRAY